MYIGGGCAGLGTGPRVVGAAERVRVIDADLEVLARIDTGAAACSLHAEEIEVDWDQVHFVLSDGNGVRQRLSAPIADHAWVNSAHGKDLRPRVALQLELGGVRKRVLVSLRDRSRMQYKMLVGRDFLAGDFVVDVARGEGAE
jgi:hypothetical protein